ncbi:hypothetical protein ABZV14_27835 [Streptosporangium canum]|uniref:hypothetical protein n=1 Tax=Streptosporangium canum TaxID=324952 RepID=UPI0033AB757D
MPRISDLTNALPQLADDSARHVRLATAARAKLGRALGARDLRKLADADPELNTHLTGAADALAEEDRAAVTWQKALTAATKQWEAALAELSKVHPDRD